MHVRRGSEIILLEDETAVRGHTGDPGGQLGFQPTEVTFLQKPFALDALSKKLKEVLDER
jgi:hypothetical protein